MYSILNLLKKSCFSLSKSHANVKASRGEVERDDLFIDQLLKMQRRKGSTLVSKRRSKNLLITMNIKNNNSILKRRNNTKKNRVFPMNKTVYDENVICSLNGINEEDII